MVKKWRIMMEHKVSIREHSIIDHKTGEVKREIESISYPFTSEEGYIKLYLKHACYLQGLQHSEHSILYELFQFMNYHNEVPLLKKYKKDILRDTGLSMNTLNQALTQMVAKKILFRIQRGLYKVNPYLFGKGSWKNIKKLRMTIDYNPNDYKVRTTIVRGKNDIFHSE